MTAAWCSNAVCSQLSARCWQQHARKGSAHRAPLHTVCNYHSYTFVSMVVKRNTTNESRAVGHVHVLAARDLLCHDGPESPGMRAVVKRHKEVLKHELSRPNMLRAMGPMKLQPGKKLEPHQEQFRALVRGLDAAQLEDPSSIVCKDACLAAFHVVPRKGNPPVLTFQEEADIAWWAFGMAEKGYTRGRHQIEAEIVRLCKANHAEHPVTEGIMLCGLSNEVFTGFMSCWDYLMTKRFSDLMNGQRRAINKRRGALLRERGRLCGSARRHQSQRAALHRALADRQV